MKELVISGNEAIAHGAIRGGCRFFAGYPITPSSEIAEVLSLELPRVRGKFIQMEDEMGSIAAIIGASLTGKKAMTATSGPGFSLMQEHIGFAVMGEVPCVVVDVQRGGPSTGLPTHPSQGDVMQARWGTHGDHEIIALSPSSVQECYTLIIEAFNLSEEYRTPVIFLTDEVIGHLREKLIIPDDESIEVTTRKKPADPPDSYKPFDLSKGKVPPLANFGSGYKFHITGLIHDETGFPKDDSSNTQILINRITNKIKDNRDKIVKTETFMMDDAEIALVSYGSVFRTAKEAVIEAREQGIKMGVLKLTTIWPFADKEVAEVAEQVRAMAVVEMNMGQLKTTVESCIKGKCELCTVCRADGNIVAPSDVHSKLREVGIVH